MKILLLAICLSLFGCASLAVAQDKTTGGVRGTVRMQSNGNKLTGVTVTAVQDEKEIASAKTDGKGDFTLAGLKHGVYTFVFAKTGLSQGTLTNVEVKANTILTLKRLNMEVDQGSLAVVRGSVFDPDGRGVRGARVEIAKISGNSVKKIGEGYSGEFGEFTFRLPPDAAQYRVTVSIKGAETAAKTLEINGAQIYNTAVSLRKSEK